METQRRRERGARGERNSSALSASPRFKTEPEQMAEAQQLDAVIRQNLEVLGYGE